MDEVELLQVFDFFGELEKSEKPDLEKIPTLILYAEKLYSSINIEPHETIKGYSFDEKDAVWLIKDLSPSEILKQSQQAYKNYQEQYALENMEKIYEFYKTKYEKLMKINRPFFDYTLKLLKSIKKNVNVIQEGKKATDEIMELRNTVKLQEQTITLVKEKNKKIEHTLETVEERLEKQMLNASSYKDWLDLLSARKYIQSEMDVRVLAHVLIRDESTRDEIATRCNISYSQALDSVNSLVARGMLKEETRGRRKIITINHDYLIRGKIELQKRRESKTEQVLKNVHGWDEEKKVSEELGKYEDTTRANSTEQKNV